MIAQFYYMKVKKILMSDFDANKRKYQNEIIELASEIYNSGAGSYYRGQAIDRAVAHSTSWSIPATICPLRCCTCSATSTIVFEGENRIDP